MRKVNLSSDLLKKLYISDKLTLQEISCELGVSRQTVANKLTEYGIPIHNFQSIRAEKEKSKKVFRLKKVYPYKNKDRFEAAYKELKSLELVAKHFGISQDTAYSWKKRLGISTIKEFSFKGREKLNTDKPYANKEWLEDMYAKYSWEDLGKMLNCNPTTLSKWGAKFGIKTRTHSEQWDVKAKFGNKYVTPTGFDLQLYKNTYDLAGVHLSRQIKKLIIDLYGKCESCGYTEVLDLHHIDENHSNNSPENHCVLCPNCHAKVHRLGIPFSVLVPNHVSWELLLPNNIEVLDSYQEAK